VELGDVMALFWGLRGVVETSGEVVPGAWQRYLDIHLAGLRSPVAPASGAAVTREQLRRINGSHTDPGNGTAGTAEAAGTG
jgi:hypothetical protein